MLDKYVIVKYLRLSLDDGDKEESDSIGNQRNLLDYCRRHVLVFYCDRSNYAISISKAARKHRIVYATQ